MSDIDARVKRMMKRVRTRGALPSSQQIVAETFRRLGYDDGSITPDQVLGRFDETLRSVFVESLYTLEAHEERVYVEGIPSELVLECPDELEEARRAARERGFQEGAIRLFRGWYPFLRRAFLSISQSRKTRGGKDFELQVEGLLALARIPFDRQERTDRTDLILPSLEQYRANKTISAVVSVKRTLRERWREVVEELENLRAPNVYLFTADDNVSREKGERIVAYNIHLVVWDAVKERSFADVALVEGYTDWATGQLAVLMRYWQSPA